MPMRDQPEGVRRLRRGSDKPPREYGIEVDGELAGRMERLPKGEWRAYRDGEWPRKFGGAAAFLAGAGWIAAVHRAARSTSEPVTVTERAEVQEVPPAVADPFRGDPFADPLA
jgi:hypothetical protein